MTDERNFRTYYYEKFGVHGVEEKKSIEILLNEHPLDVEKLRQFCLRFPVPAMYRTYLWKVLLGIIPANQDCQDFVMKQRVQQYNDLHHAITLMRRVDDSTPLAEVFLRMYLIEMGTLPFEEHNILSCPSNKAFVAIARAVCSVVEDSTDAYWITTKFVKLFSKSHDLQQQLPEKTGQCLKKEDVDQKLWNHFQIHDLWSSLPLADWFSCCFAGTLPDASFERIWDKVIGGSCVILAYVAVAIFCTFRRPLLSMNNKEAMISYLEKIPEDSGDILVSKAIDLCQKHGGHLFPPKSESPVHVERPSS